MTRHEIRYTCPKCKTIITLRQSLDDSCDRQRDAQEWWKHGNRHKIMQKVYAHMLKCGIIDERIETVTEGNKDEKSERQQNS